MASEEMAKITRKSQSAIRVYCLPEERAVIQYNARRAGLDVSRFLREVGQGYEIHGIVDCEQVLKMSGINGDLGRLGGLLKLWLSDDPRAAKFGPETIRAVLHKIEADADEIGRIMQSVVTRTKSDGFG